MKENLTIRLETEKDYRAVENLTREAFWNVYRPGCVEHFVLHKFRMDKDFVSELDFVMEKNGELIGHVMYARAKIVQNDGKQIPMITFGPISIAPKYKRQGYGKKLLDYSMEKAQALGAKALAITGDINFYGKSGFVVASTKGIRYYAEPNGVAPYFLIKQLQDGFLDNLTGVFKEPDGYYIDEKQAEQFDQTFPHKEKLKLDSQLF